MPKSTPTNKQQSYLKTLAHALGSSKNDKDLFEAIVNAPFADKLQAVEIDLGIVVLLLVNKKTKTIDRIALSKTEQAKEAVKMSAKPFHEIKIPLQHDTNIIAKAISSGEPHITDDWYYLFTPDMPAEAARFNQAGAGIECSMVCPFNARDGGALIFSFFQPPQQITPEHYAFAGTYADLVATALS